LHRSATERVVLGVCGGLAEQFDLDPSLVRIGFVVATLWGGVGLILYLILGIVLPLEDADMDAAASPRRAERSRSFAGLLLLVVGSLLLLSNLGWAPWLTWNMFWASVLVLVGLGLLAVGSSGPKQPLEMGS
jgi:phage shock protein PspC (stress-responsive transcriptional regulator)